MKNTIQFRIITDLKLPDGRLADTVDRLELARILVTLGVEGVDANTPKFESLDRYRAHMEAVQAAAVEKYTAQFRDDAA